MEKLPDKKVVERNLKDLMLCQINQTKKGDYFKRFDVIIRYMVIENFYDKNDYGIDLYIKMYKKIFPRRSKEVILKRLERFKRLITLAENKQFDTKKYPITLTPRFNIWDGSHRVACAIYFRRKSIFVLKIRKEFKHGCDFGFNRFKKTFTDEEWELINKKKDEILKKI